MGLCEFLHEVIMRAGHFCLWRYTPKQARPPLFATSQTVRDSPSPTSSKFFWPSKAPVLCVPNEASVADTSLPRLLQTFDSRKSFPPLMAPSHWATSDSPIKTGHAITKVNAFYSPFGTLPDNTCASISTHTRLHRSQPPLLALGHGQRPTHTTTTNSERFSLLDCSY